MEQLSVQSLKSWLDDPSRPDPVLLDVREGWELELAKLEGVRHIVMNTIPARIAELDPDAETVVICHHGGRSQQVAMFLERQGFTKVFNLAGGVHAWALAVDATMAKY